MTTTTIDYKTSIALGVLSNNDSNSIVLFYCDGCNEIRKHLTCFASSPDKKYLCDECLHK